MLHNLILYSCAKYTALHVAKPKGGICSLVKKADASFWLCMAVYCYEQIQCIVIVLYQTGAPLCTWITTVHWCSSITVHESTHIALDSHFYF